MSILAAALLVFGAESAAQAGGAVLIEPDPSGMSQKEIREFNAQLPRSHPFYIRCIKSDETGSLARKVVSCRTNRQWEVAYTVGNQEARDAAALASSKFEATIDPEPIKGGE
ncbi:MAG: hypothetical protein U1E37_05140 [Sphingomonadaceae bacterium]